MEDATESRLEETIESRLDCMLPRLPSSDGVMGVRGDGAIGLLSGHAKTIGEIGEGWMVTAAGGIVREGRREARERAR